MKPRRTVESNVTFVLAGGNEDNDLWATRDHDQDGDPIIRTTWEPSDDERVAISQGSNIELVIWGKTHPATMVRTTEVELGRPRGR